MSVVIRTYAVGDVYSINHSKAGHHYLSLFTTVYDVSLL